MSAMALRRLDLPLWGGPRTRHIFPGANAVSTLVRTGFMICFCLCSINPFTSPSNALPTVANSLLDKLALHTTDTSRMPT
eukprot:764363-Hanusia_phi.AAC.4